MKVLKFGGTSVGSSQRMNEVMAIINDTTDQKVIVLSAMSGTTNSLTDICTAANKNAHKAAELVDELYLKYLNVVSELYSSLSFSSKAMQEVNVCFEEIRQAIANTFTQQSERIVLAQGELISTNLFLLLCQEHGLAATIVNALDFMRIDASNEPDLDKTKKNLLDYQSLWSTFDIVITQGYICRNHYGEIDNLKRGGSDYTATIIGACLNADEIQIWTDIDGFQNNDPRIVDNTNPVRKMSYREAAELAYFGAKILHPTCVMPAEKSNVPIRLKCTLTPESEGTLIGSESSARAVTAIAAKDGITAINITSHRMLNAFGFLRRVFEVFEKYKTPVDMITTSEVAVSVTIDNNDQLDKIGIEISEFAEFAAVDGYSIICIVGNELYSDSSLVGSIFGLLETVPIKMVSMGGSDQNISVLVPSSDKNKALLSLNKVFDVVLDPSSF